MVPLYTLITGKGFEDPYDIEYHQERGVFLLKENGETLEEVDFVPRPAFFGKKTSRGTPMEALADVRAQKLILTAYQRCRFWEAGISAISARFSPAATAQGR